MQYQSDSDEEPGLQGTGNSSMSIYVDSAMPLRLCSAAIIGIHSLVLWGRAAKIPQVGLYGEKHIRDLMSSPTSCREVPGRARRVSVLEFDVIQLSESVCLWYKDIDAYVREVASLMGGRQCEQPVSVHRNPYGHASLWLVISAATWRTTGARSRPMPAADCLVPAYGKP